MLPRTVPPTCGLQGHGLLRGSTLKPAAPLSRPGCALPRHNVADGSQCRQNAFIISRVRAGRPSGGTLPPRSGGRLAVRAAAGPSEPQAPGPGPASSAGPPASPPPLRAQQAPDYVRALVLAYLSAQNRSLLGARCLVETLLHMYRSGVSLDDVKLSVSLAVLESGGKLLAPIHQDMLLSWVATVMITFDVVGVPPYPEAAALRERQGSAGGDDVTGLRAMVAAAVERFLSGTDLFRLQLQQAMQGKVEGDEEAAGASPAVRLLQQTTRLTVIACETLRALRLRTDMQLVPAPAPPSAADESDADTESESDDEGTSSATGLASVGYLPAFLPGTSPMDAAEAAAAADAGAAPRPGRQAVALRACSVRLLVGFMGAALGYAYGAWDFVAAAAAAYRAGWTADEVFAQLRDEEYAQSGGVMPVGIAQLPGGRNISAAVFARWLSVVYMALAQMGVPFPGAAERTGWAWVCSLGGQEPDAGPSALEAHGMAEFVSGALRNEMAKVAVGNGGASAAEGQEAELSAGGAALATLRPPDARAAEQPDGFTSMSAIPDDSLLRTSPTALIVSQQMSLVHMARALVLDARRQAAAGGGGGEEAASG